MESHRILSERLAIRPFAPEDVTDEYLGWLNDRELMRYSRQRLRVHTRESSEEYLRNFVLSPNHFWNVARREDASQVGTATAYVDPTGAMADVGLMIGRPGLGYGSEAFGAILAFLFEHDRLGKVTTGTLRVNAAMVRIAYRWGLRREGTRREEVGDGSVDVDRFAILRSEWMSRKQRSRIVVETGPQRSGNPSSRG